jgi:iron(III) transport system substrate-binding protein
MGRTEAAWSAALVAALAIAIAPPAARADAAWDALVKAAISEGEVDVHGGPGAVFEKVLTEHFRAAYPAIKINFSGTSGRDVIEQILRERQAGIYKWDVYVGGTPSILQTLKPAGAFQPLRPMLLLPDVLADATWFGGFDFGWVDNEKTYTFAWDFTLNPVVWVNWDVVKQADLRSFADLAKPQFAGKIVWDDPRFPGAGQLVGQTMLVNFGEPALIKLFAEQKIVYTTNRRQNAEWVVRGRYPIGLAMGTEDLAIFQEQGLGKNVTGLVPEGLKILGSIGFGTVSAMDKPPHPNAAKLYINWLLSKDGQADIYKTGRNSRRLDAKPGAPDQLPRAGETYLNSQAEAQIPVRDRVAELAKQHIPAGAAP